jgi:spore germination protein GerM
VSRGTSILSVALALVLAGCGGASHAKATTKTAETPTAAASASVEVCLLQGEGLKLVRRQLAARTVAGAVGALLKGPTNAEAKAGITTQVPRGTRLRRASVTSGTATID